MSEETKKRTVTKDGRRVSGKSVEPDWSKPCEACGAKPVLPLTGLCGPCTFGEADTSGGNW